GDRLRVWANEHNTRGGQGLRKCFSFGQKSIAGVDCLGAALPASVDDLFDDEVAFSCGGRPYGHRGIRHRNVQGILVGFRINGDRFDTHLARGFDDPAGDFTAIGNEDTLEHSVYGPRCWLASLRQKSQSRSYDGTKESVIQNAIPAATRQAKTKPARH